MFDENRLAELEALLHKIIPELEMLRAERGAAGGTAHNADLNTTIHGVRFRFDHAHTAWVQSGAFQAFFDAGDQAAIIELFSENLNRKSMRRQ